VLPRSGQRKARVEASEREAGCDFGSVLGFDHEHVVDETTNPGIGQLGMLTKLLGELLGKRETRECAQVPKRDLPASECGLDPVGREV